MSQTREKEDVGAQKPTLEVKLTVRISQQEAEYLDDLVHNQQLSSRSDGIRYLLQERSPGLMAVRLARSEDGEQWWSLYLDKGKYVVHYSEQVEHPDNWTVEYCSPELFAQRITRRDDGVQVIRNLVDRARLRAELMLK